MGYLSEVAVAIKPNYYTALIDGIPDNEKAVRELISKAEVHSHEDGVLIHWPNIKWYYDECERFMASLKNVDSEHWVFVEIGEDFDDNKNDGGWWSNPFDLSIQRSIYMRK